jgi:hypothetical protein
MQWLEQNGQLQVNPKDYVLDASKASNKLFCLDCAVATGEKRSNQIMFFLRVSATSSLSARTGWG